MFSNTKPRDVRKFSRKPQSKFVASRRSQKLKRRDEIETKYTDDRFVAFTTTEAVAEAVAEAVTDITSETVADITSEEDRSNLEIIDQTIAELEAIYNSINGTDAVINNNDYINDFTEILEKY